MSVRIEIRGQKEVNKLLKDTERGINKGVMDGMTKAALHMQNEVKLSIAGRSAETRSVDTGRFLNSIGKQVLKDNAIIYSLVPYAKFLEYGTSRFVGRRHFTNSLARNKQVIAKILGEEVKSQVKSSI